MAGKGEGPAIGIDLGTKYSCGMEMAEMEMEMEERSFVVSSDPHQVHPLSLLSLHIFTITPICWSVSCGFFFHFFVILYHDFGVSRFLFRIVNIIYNTGDIDSLMFGLDSFLQLQICQLDFYSFSFSI